MGYIYKITNKVNNKVYIGKTEFSIEKRFKEHISDARKDKNKDRPLYRAINKYGEDNFYIELIEETDNLEEMEIYYISQYRSYIGFDDCNGYNATLGGDSKKYIDYEAIVEYYKSHPNIQVKEIANHFKIDNGYCSKILKKYDIEIPHVSNFKTTHHDPKKVIKYDLDNNYICIYNSALEAGRDLGSDAMRTHILECCEGKRKTAYGFKWNYYNSIIAD